MKKRFFIFNLLVTFFVSSSTLISAQDQPQVAFGPNSIDRVREEDRQSLKESLSNFLKAINTNSFDSCYSIDFAYLQEEWFPFLYLDDAQKSGKYNDPWFFKPIVTYAFPLDDESYEVKIAFIGNEPASGSPIFRLIYSLKAIKKGNVFQFYNVLETVKAKWKNEKIGKIRYYFNDSFDYEKAKEFSEFNTQMSNKFELEEIDVSYFKCRDGRELFYIIGCDYINNTYFAKTGGLADRSRNYLFAGNNSESYPHELVHLYVTKKFSGSRNYIAEEGYCTFIGGSGELSYGELLGCVKKYLNEQPEEDLLELFITDFQINGEHSTMYAISALMMDEIEKKHGSEGIRQIIQLENGHDSYFKKLFELLGINKENFSEKVTPLL